MNGGAWRCMEVHGGAWRCMEVHGGAWRCMEVHGGAGANRRPRDAYFGEMAGSRENRRLPDAYLPPPPSKWRGCSHLSGPRPLIPCK